MSTISRQLCAQQSSGLFHTHPLSSLPQPEHPPHCATLFICHPGFEAPSNGRCALLSAAPVLRPQYPARVGKGFQRRPHLPRLVPHDRICAFVVQAVQVPHADAAQPLPPCGGRLVLQRLRVVVPHLQQDQRKSETNKLAQRRIARRYLGATLSL